MTHALAVEVNVTDEDAKLAQSAFPALDMGAAICAYLQAKLYEAKVLCTVQGVFYEPPK